jgi:hypothetical protein
VNARIIFLGGAGRSKEMRMMKQRVTDCSFQTKYFRSSVTQASSTRSPTNDLFRTNSRIIKFFLAGYWWLERMERFSTFVTYSNEGVGLLLNNLSWPLPSADLPLILPRFLHQFIAAPQTNLRPVRKYYKDLAHRNCLIDLAEPRQQTPRRKLTFQVALMVVCCLCAF